MTTSSPPSRTQRTRTRLPSGWQDVSHLHHLCQSLDLSSLLEVCSLIVSDRKNVTFINTLLWVIHYQHRNAWLHHIHTKYTSVHTTLITISNIAKPLKVSAVFETNAVAYYQSTPSHWYQSSRLKLVSKYYLLAHWSEVWLGVGTNHV